MQFLFHKDAKNQEITLEGEAFSHIYHSRRTDKTKPLKLRNLKDDMLYTYHLISIGRKSATLSLQDSIFLPKKPLSFSHIIWAITDVKTIEKTLPFLNELGLGKLSLFYAALSQHNQNPNIQRCEKILIASSQQCGRSNVLEIEILSNISEVLHLYPNIARLDFEGEAFESVSSLDSVLVIGPEGGFSKEESTLIQTAYTLPIPFILKSQTAIITALAMGINRNQ